MQGDLFLETACVAYQQTDEFTWYVLMKEILHLGDGNSISSELSFTHHASDCERNSRRGAANYSTSSNRYLLAVWHLAARVDIELIPLPTRNTCGHVNSNKLFYKWDKRLPISSVWSNYSLNIRFVEFSYATFSRKNSARFNLYLSLHSLLEVVAVPQLKPWLKGLPEELTVECKVEVRVMDLDDISSETRWNMMMLSMWNLRMDQIKIEYIKSSTVLTSIQVLCCNILYIYRHCVITVSCVNCYVRLWWSRMRRSNSKSLPTRRLDQPQQGGNGATAHWIS